METLSVAADENEDKPKPKPKPKGRPGAPAIGQYESVEESDDEGISASVTRKSYHQMKVSELEARFMKKSLDVFSNYTPDESCTFNEKDEPNDPTHEQVVKYARNN